MKDMSLFEKVKLLLESYKKNQNQDKMELLNDPLTLAEEFNLPKSRCEILRWVRIYFNTEPLVNELVTSNAQKSLPLFSLKTSSSTIGEFYNDMAFNDHFNLQEFMQLFSLSYYKFGEAIPFGNMEENKNGKSYWHNFILIEPELIEIKTDMISGVRSFEMIPTEELKEMVNDKKVVKQLPEIIVKSIKQQKNIPLDESCTSLVGRFTDPSATRGTSPIQCLFKVLLLIDKMRLDKKGSASEWSYLKDQISLVLKLDPMVHRTVRSTFENWMLNKYFKPIAEKNNFRSKGKLILPQIVWEK